MIDSGGTSVLTTKDLSIGYPQEDASQCIAESLDLSLDAGEFVCLLGPNGCGKSTLIRSLSGMQSPLGGSIRVCGRDFQNIPPRQRARLVSVVLTDALPAGMMDAYAMVALGRHPYSGWFGSLNTGDKQRIEWALEAVGAQHLAFRQIAELSDGERQKISIARALAQETKLMLLDEPTAYLDLPRRVELMRILRDLAHREKLGLLLSTHDLDLALRFADKLWLLNESGELVRGYPEAIAMSGDFARVFESANLDWDPESGSFRTHPEPCLHAKVEGDGIASLWTKRALERLGFGLTADTRNASFSVQIEDNSIWQVHRANQSMRFQSIAELIDWLRSENWCKDGEAV